MYAPYFGLQSPPFRLTPDTSCFFGEGQRKAILDGLIYALNNGDGIIKVIGEVGSGKTLLSRVLEQKLPDHFEILYILNPRIPPDRILFAIAMELGLEVPSNTDKVLLLHQLHNKLLDLHKNQKQTVVFIDEAQCIPLETLEEIRMLSNLETGVNKLLQIVLFGQPELDVRLRKHSVRQIKGRIAHSFYLPPLESNETYRYLDFRLRSVGYNGPSLFNGLAVRMINFKSGGLLRAVNILADKALLAAYSKQSKQVGVSQVLQSILDGFPMKTVVNSIVCISIILIVISSKVFAFSPIDLITRYYDHSLVTELVSPIPLLNDNVVRDGGLVSFPEQEETTIQQLVQTRIRESQKWLGKPSAGRFSIKLLQIVTPNTKLLETLLARQLPVEMLQQVYLLSHKKGSKTVWSVYLSEYDSYTSATESLSRLQKKLKKNQPYIVRLSTLKKFYV